MTAIAEARPQQTTQAQPALLVRLFNSLLDLYAVGTIIVLVAHYAVGERWNVVALVNNLLHLLLLTTPVVLVMTLLVRRWSAAALLLFPLGVTIFHYLPSFMARTALPVTGEPITVLSYNLLGRDDSDGLNTSADIILEADADVVLLQEVGFTAEKVFNFRLAEEYPYVALHPRAWANAGQGVYSRYSINADEYWHAENRLNVYLGHQRVGLNINDTQVVIYNVHPLHPGMVGLDVSLRGDDLDTVLERVAEEPEEVPVLVAGDFNMTDFTQDYQRVRDLGYRDAFRDVGMGFGFTFPATLPVQLLRLDYVFYDAQWQATSAAVIRDHGGSDHYPLRVEMTLLDEESSTGATE